MYCLVVTITIDLKTLTVSEILANVQSTVGFGSSDIRKIAQVWKIKMLTIAEANALLARNLYPYSRELIEEDN